MFSELSIFITDYNFATPVSIPTTTISRKVPNPKQKTTEPLH